MKCHNVGVPNKTAEDLLVEARIRAHIRAAMSERGISQAELSRRLKYSDSAMARLLGGERGALRPGLLVRLCQVLGVSPTRLLLEDPPSQYFEEGSERLRWKRGNGS